MRGLRRALIGLAGLAIVFGAGAIATVLTSDHESTPAATAVLVLLAGFGFVGTGLFAWDRRPGNNVGPLMVAGGFAVFLAALGDSNDQVIWLIGGIGGSLFYAIFVHLLLAFPSGVLRTRTERWLVVLGYVDTTIVQLLWVVFTDPVKDGCDNCPANPLLIHNSDVAGVIDAGQVIVAIGLIGIAVGILVHRWRHSPPGQRRAVRPVYFLGALSFGLELVQLTVDQLNLAPGL